MTHAEHTASQFSLCRPIWATGRKLRGSGRRVLSLGSGIARGARRSQHLAAVRASRGSALAQEEPDYLRRLIVGQPEPIAQCPDLVARAGTIVPLARMRSTAASNARRRWCGCPKAGCARPHNFRRQQPSEDLA
jgi:hypothetical protein